MHVQLCELPELRTRSEEFVGGYGSLSWLKRTQEKRELIELWRSAEVALEY
jgi:hypothetical protein